MNYKYIEKDKNDIPTLKETVLTWLSSMKTGENMYTMNHGADYSAYTNCFAIFIKDLFGVSDSLSTKERIKYAHYFNSFQDQETGLYYPNKGRGNPLSKPVLQLTTFCLDALDILKAEPKYNPYQHIEKLIIKKNVVDTLIGLGTFKGVSTTGNMAMFLAILITRKYQQEKTLQLREMIEQWFSAHNQNQNERSGFWGKGLSKRYYAGFQNAFHQFVIYTYWDKSVQYYNKIVDTILKLQDGEGHWAPIPGGGGCYDYDAVDILINIGLKNNYRINDIERSLLKIYNTLIKSQNLDGGFCESRIKPESILTAINKKAFKYYLGTNNPYVFIYRVKHTISSARRARKIIKTHWTKYGRNWNQSDLWNTWFRSLTIAQIYDQLKGDHQNVFRYHKNIGLGYFKPNKDCNGQQKPDTKLSCF